MGISPPVNNREASERSQTIDPMSSSVSPYLPIGVREQLLSSPPVLTAERRES